MKTIMLVYHTLVFWIVIVTLSITLGIIASLAGLFDSTGNTSHRIASLWSRLLCRLNGIEVDIRGLEHVARDHAQVFVANHQGFFDIFTLSGFLPVQIRWMAKASLFKIPFVGWSMRAARYIGVEREDKKKSFQAFLAMIEKVKAGYSVVIFPEGTRTLDGDIGPFKKGGHLLAARSGAPIVPVTIIGSMDIMKKGSFLFRPSCIRIVISPPVTIVKSNGENGEAVMDRVRDIIRREYVRA